MHYRRRMEPGQRYFFTVNLADRSSGLLTERIDVLRSSIAQVKRRHPFEIIAWVVMPEHMHALWALPADDCNYSLRWSLIKSTFSRQIEKTEPIGTSRMSRRERGIWQRRFWEHRIRDDRDLRTHIDYIHHNPVKHGHSLRATDWPYSTIHRH